MWTRRAIILLLALVTTTAPVAGASGAMGDGSVTDAPAIQPTKVDGQNGSIATGPPDHAGPPTSSGPADDEERIRAKIVPRNPQTAAMARATIDVRHDFGHTITTDLTPQQFEALRHAPGLTVSRVMRVSTAHHKSGHGNGGGDEVTVTWRRPTDGDTIDGAVALEVAASTTKSNVDRVEWRVDGGTWRAATEQGGSWTATWDSTAVADGAHTLTARATNKRGATGEASVGVTTDNVNEPPSVSWTNPTDGDAVTGDVAIAIEAADPDGNVSAVTWRVGDGAERTATYDESTGQWEATWDSSTVADGDHSLTATVTDDDGATSTSRVTVGVDNENAAPSVTWHSPTGGDTVTGAVEIAIEADDSDGSVGDVTWRVGSGAERSSTYNASTGLWEATWNSSTVQDGDVRLVATATDDEGANTSEAVTVTVDNENEPPTVKWVEPQDGDTINGTVDIRLAAADTDSSISTVTWQIEDGGELATTYNTSTGEYEATWNTTDAQTGTYNLTATAQDSDGATDTATITVSVDRPNESPTVSWRTPTDGAVLNGTVQLQIDAADADGTVTNVTWATGSGVSRQATYDETADAWVATWNTSTVQDGTYTLWATATDDEGASSNAAIDVSVDNVDYEPYVYWRTPVEGDVVSGNATVEITPEDDGTIETVEWRVDDGSWRTASRTSSGIWADTWSTEEYGDGSHTLTAVAVDDAGQSARAVVNVTVDNEDAAVETTWEAPRDGASVRGDQAVSLVTNGTADVETVEWQVDDGTYRSTTYNATTEAWEATWATGETWAGSHDLTARTTTAAGGVDTTTITVSVEPTPDDQTPYGIEQVYDDTTIERTSGGDGVDVAVLDTGVDTDHPDLRDSLVRCVDAGGFGTCEDGHGHGTHVAGTVLADAGSDGAGIYGVAPDANLHSYKVLSDSGGGYADDIAAAIDDAAANDVEVVSMSLGASSESSLIESEIEEHRGDLVVVAAAGNSGPDLDTIGYPAANNDSIAVAAVDETDAVTSFSSRGVDADAFCACERYVEVAAAGAAVESTATGGGYTTMSGTSMATPHVSGFVAKVWASGAADLDADGTVTPSEVREYVRSRAVDVTDGEYAGTGYDPASGVGRPVLP